MGMKRVPGGLLVAIEGIDGAGKTTVARALESWLVGVGALEQAHMRNTHFCRQRLRLVIQNSALAGP